MKNREQSKLITQVEVDQYELLEPLLNGIYHEFQELSKKKSDAILNAYKVKMVNRVLEPARDLMKNESVLHFLDIFEDDDLPTNSDVILVLSHYKKAMESFYDKYYMHGQLGNFAWAIKELD